MDNVLEFEPPIDPQAAVELLKAVIYAVCEESMEQGLDYHYVICALEEIKLHLLTGE